MFNAPPLLLTTVPHAATWILQRTAATLHTLPFESSVPPTEDTEKMKFGVGQRSRNKPEQPGHPTHAAIPRPFGKFN